MNLNYYEILNIETNASNEEIKRAYRRLSLLYHPDKNNNDNDKSVKFKNIGTAYHTLINNITRNKYDRENNIINTSTNINNNMEYVTNNNREYETNNNKEYYIDNRDYHINNRDYHINNRDYHINNNHNSRMEYKNSINSYPINSHFNQYNIYNLPKPIEICKEINFYQSYYGDNIPININRDIFINNEHYSENETIYINIESGIDNNEIITVNGKGNIKNNISGDVKIKIILTPDNIFKRRGLDLIYTKNISFKESICGFSFILKHINGKSYTINNNTGIIINPNYKTSISKLGFKKNDNIGNLLIEYNIEYPDKLNKITISKIENIL